MAIFRVGQRVRVVAADYNQHCVGKEAVIAALPGANPIYETAYGCAVAGESAPASHLGLYWGDACCFAPLTDPFADAFIARIKKLGREPVIVPEKVTV